MVTRSQVSYCLNECHHLAGELRWLSNQVGDRVIRDLMIAGSHRMDMCMRECQFALDRLNEIYSEAVPAVSLPGPQG